MGLGLCLSINAGSSSAQQNLPKMGEPADTALSPAEEQELGARFMRQIRTQLPLITDVQVSEYIQNLGNRLVLATGRTDLNNFTFFVIDDPQINAFAIPGGYVGINTGLIAAMQFEEQLASVVAHEIAHVTQRHHARSFATGNQTSLATAAAILAAIIIGQASPQAGQAALAAGIAATHQTAINFTRSNEIEADRIGIEILANADYDARAMAETFGILRRKNSINTSNGALEYLRTHPLDNNRIAEAADRSSSKQVKDRVNSLEFNLFKARLDVLTSADMARTQRVSRSQYARNPDAAGAYTVAFISHLNNDPQLANEYLNKLEAIVPYHPMVELLHADIDTSDKRTDVLSRMKDLTALYPQRYSIVEKRLEILIRNQQLSEAMQVTKRYIRTAQEPNPLAWRQLANIQQQLNNDAGSHESLARYFESIDAYDQAQSQLELALKEVAAGTQDQIRLSASLKYLKSKAARFR